MTSTQRLFRTRTLRLALLPAALMCLGTSAWAQDDSGSGQRPADSSAEATDESGQRDPAPAEADLAQDSVLRAQILLERAYFSPGEIDGKVGSNTRRALVAYQRAHELDASGELDAPTWERLRSDEAPVLVRHTLTEGDVSGPFAETPATTQEKAQADALPFNSVEEKLGEQFHASPGLLQELNPDVELSAGTEITVPNIASARGLPSATRVVVDESDSSLLLEDADGKVVAHFPVTTGSEQFPLPIGEWTIKGVAPDPVWYYDPALIAGSAEGAEKAQIPPGPNNPVGNTWIDLSKEHYGIHGTPDPSQVSKNASNGCIRMTNWSATALGRLVRPGMDVLMRK